MGERIQSLLPPTALAIYSKAVPSPLQSQLEQKLAAIGRLTDPKFEKWTSLNNFKENDLDHVCDMLAYVNEIEASCPNLAKEVNLDDVRFMVILHDIGEIYVGDIPTCGPLRNSKEGAKKKHLEPVMALMKVIAKMPDEHPRRKAEELYCRYNAQDIGDKEAKLAKYIDRASGTSRVNSPNVFANWRLAGLPEPPQELTEHVTLTESRMLQQANNFMASLSLDSRVEFIKLFNKAISLIREAGY